MRLGLDLDGVLVDFNAAYRRAIVNCTGRDLFVPGDDINPVTWNWPEHRGYTASEMARVWRGIASSQSFWYTLGATPHVETLDLIIKHLEHEHDVYFVTARIGPTAKRQTEAWLLDNLSYDSDIRPTVIISGDKGAIASALRLDCYIDDRGENALAVASTLTRSYLLNRSYNRGMILPGVTRVDSLGEFLDAELSNL